MQLEINDWNGPSTGKKFPKIRDSQAMLFSSKRFDETATIEGKARLREETRGRLNRILGQGRAQAVYFTDFVAR